MQVCDKAFSLPVSQFWSKECPGEHFFSYEGPWNLELPLYRPFQMTGCSGMQMCEQMLHFLFTMTCEFEPWDIPNSWMWWMPSMDDTCVFIDILLLHRWFKYHCCARLSKNWAFSFWVCGITAGSGLIGKLSRWFFWNLHFKWAIVLTGSTVGVG